MTHQTESIAITAANVILREEKYITTAVASRNGVVATAELVAAELTEKAEPDSVEAMELALAAADWAGKVVANGSPFMVSLKDVFTRGEATAGQVRHVVAAVGNTWVGLNRPPVQADEIRLKRKAV